MRRLLHAATLVIVSVTAAPAMARPIAVIVRGVGGHSERAAGIVSHELRMQLDADSRYEAVDLADLLGGDAADKARKAFEIAAESLTKGRAAYDSLEMGAAIDELNTANSKFERHAAFVSDISKVTEVLMLLGAAQIMNGEEKPGARRLSQAIALDSKVEPDPRVFNPEMRAVFQEAATKLAKKSPGGLSINSTPGFAEVYLDGRFVGVTPVVLEQVVEGRHYVRVVREGYRPWGKVVEVTAQSETTETATLKEADNQEDFETGVEAFMANLADKTPGKEVGKAVESLRQQLKVDELLFAEVRLDGDRVRVLAVLVNDKQVLRVGKTTFSYDSKIETYTRELEVFVRNNFGPQVVAAGDEGAAAQGGGLVHAGGGECMGMSCRRFKTVVLAVGAGGGVLLGGIGGLLDYMAYSANSDYMNTPQVSPDSEAYKSSGKKKALIGDVLIGVGVAAIAAGVGTYLFWNPAPSTSEVVNSKSSGWSLGALPDRGGATVFLLTDF